MFSQVRLPLQITLACMSNWHKTSQKVASPHTAESASLLQQWFLLPVSTLSLKGVGWFCICLPFYSSSFINILKLKVNRIRASNLKGWIPTTPEEKHCFLFVSSCRKGLSLRKVKLFRTNKRLLRTSNIHNFRPPGKFLHSVLLRPIRASGICSSREWSFLY